MALTIEARLEKAAKQLADLKALKAKQDAKLRVLASKEQRRLDNKKKILLGAFLLHQMECKIETRESVMRQLDVFLTRPADREVFGLPDKKPSPL